MVSNIVTGGAGFIGSHLVDALTVRGESVVVIDNLTSGRLANLERAISSGRVTFVYADIRDHTDSLCEIIRSTGTKHVDYIYHLAASQHGGTVSDGARELPAARDRVIAAMIEFALAYKARLIVSAPQNSVGEEQGIEPAVEQAVRHRGLDARIVRLSNCYGPRAQNGDPVIAELVEAALARRPMRIEGTGQQVWPVMYVADAVGRLLIVARHARSVSEPVDIVSSDERPVIEIARALALAAGLDFNVEYVPSQLEMPVRRRPERANGWIALDSPVTSLERGLRDTYDWFLKEDRLFV